MSGEASAGYVRDMHTLFDAGTAAGLSDGQLVKHFAGGKDSSESAFEVLVLAPWADGDACLSRRAQ